MRKIKLLKLSTCLALVFSFFGGLVSSNTLAFTPFFTVPETADGVAWRPDPTRIISAEIRKRHLDRNGVLVGDNGNGFSVLQQNFNINNTDNSINIENSAVAGSKLINVSKQQIKDNNQNNNAQQFNF